MGCDIHLYVERRDGDKWVTADKWTDDKYEPGTKSVDYDDQLYTGRNYDLFSILANVRNGSGFAGVKTGAGFVPISMPRGVPGDACEEFRAQHERWGGDGHSHSWLTLQELLDYDWMQTTEKCGWVSPAEWARWRDHGSPESWSGGVGGGRVTHHSNEEFEAAWQKVRTFKGYPEQRQAQAHLNSHRDEGDMEMFLAALGSESPYTNVKWGVTYAEAARGFWSEVMSKLLSLAKGQYEGVRIVFFFDN